MSETDWIHCNICYHVFDQERKFYILSCFHVICRICMKNSNEGKQCPLCTKSINFKEIGKTLDPKMKEFFAKDVTTSLDTPGKIINFQQKQRENLVKYIDNTSDKNRKLNNIREQMKNKFVEMHMEYDKIRQHRRLMQEKIKQIQINKLRNVQTNVQRQRAPPPSSDLDLSFERAFTANGSGSSRSQGPLRVPDIFSSPFSPKSSSMNNSSGYGSQFGS